jgi:tRNA threonylcarbamoyladenosine biosynthesis protein TsaB
VLVGGETSVRYEEPSGGQADRLLALIDAVLAEAGLGLASLDAIAAGIGPGAFTGVRIGISVAQGLAFGAGLPVVPVSTLDALAWPGIASGPVLACLDARMAEVYWACFRADPARGLAAIEPARVGPVESMRVPPGIAARGVGRGFAAHLGLAAAAAVTTRIARALPHARSIAEHGAIRLAAGEAVDPAALAPLYLRDKVALTEAERAR